MGNDLYYYDQATGEMVLSVRGRPETALGAESSSGSFGAAPYGAGAYGPGLSAASTASSVPILRIQEVEPTCRLWRNPLGRSQTFADGGECQIALENSVDRALSKLEEEEETLDKQLPVGAMPRALAAATRVERPQLKTTLAALGKQGCHCVKP
jgi:hypothetical protein